MDDAALKYASDPPPVSKPKNYEIWMGANRIFCKGRCQMGPHPSRAFLTFLLITLP